MLTIKPLFLSLAFVAGSVTMAFAQAQQNIDLAINHNRLLREKMGDGSYKLIGTYKVIGTSYLFGERNKGNMFSKEAKAFNVLLSYNTYNQELEFYSSSNPEKPLIKAPGEVDSFFLQENAELGFSTPLKFVYGEHLGTTDKSYFQAVFEGPRYSIYKKYKSELDYVSSNYIQSELRQFELNREYYYVDNQKKQIKKIKANSSSVIKEFKDVKDLSGIVPPETFTTDPDGAFVKLFNYLNN